MAIENNSKGLESENWFDIDVPTTTIKYILFSIHLKHCRL